MINDQADILRTDVSYVEWSPVVAGTVTALAVSFVLLTFGAAAGLSAVAPWTIGTASVATVSLGAAFWMLLSYVWAFSMGGYLSGRMRHRWSHNASEVEFRDGAHGLLVWALAVTLGAIVASGTIASSDRSVLFNSQATGWTEREPIASQLDSLLPPTKSGTELTQDFRQRVARLLLQSLRAPAVASKAELANRAQLVQLVALHLAIAEVDAEKRVTESIDALVTTGKRARRLAILLGFMTAAGLLVSGAAAWAAAEIGGKHRDAGTLWAGFSRVN